MFVVHLLKNFCHSEPMTHHARTRNPEAKDKTILSAARRLFAKNGIDHTSMSDVAAAAKVAVGSIYVRYPTKADLVTAVAEDFSKLFTDAMDRAADKTRSQSAPHHLPQFVAQELLKTLSENEAAFRMLMALGQDDANRGHVIGEIARHFKSAQKHGVFRRMNTPIAAAAAYGLVEGVMTAWLNDPAPKMTAYAKELTACLEGMALRTSP